jgi:pyruvate,orthophosphate dikinase
MTSLRRVPIFDGHNDVLLRTDAPRAFLESGSAASTAATPASVAFCHEIALDYVSCSPFRVPIARLAAAQAVLGKGPAGEA